LYGQTLVAWHFSAKDGRPLVLYFHGNAGTLVDPRQFLGFSA
jgi:uncharacterized protein